jgi:tRNA dimethylallyltransferase
MPDPETIPCIALAGPTACGKTAAALAIAHIYPVEIISVDSALVYRGMDIGTAKPSTEELAAVPHHLINIRDPLHAYSAAEFATDTTRLIQQIRLRGKIPLLVGGTMLYFKALAEGLDSMPSANPAMRAALEQEAQDKGWPALHSELAKIDPITAQRLAPADSQRIQRALEVYRISGLPLSHFHALQRQPAAAPYTMIALEPQDRSWLHQRIADRFDTMLTQGLLDEVRTLRARGDLHPDLPSMRCVGYRQAWEFLNQNDHLQPPSTALQELRDKGIFATRQLAKRQITWLRSMPQRIVVACDSDNAMEQVLQNLKLHISKHF